MLLNETSRVSGSYSHLFCLVEPDLIIESDFGEQAKDLDPEGIYCIIRISIIIHIVSQIGDPYHAYEPTSTNTDDWVEPAYIDK